MQNRDLRPLEHPAAWTTGEIGSPDDIAVDLTRGQWEVIDAAVHHSLRETPRDEDVTPATFPLDGLGDAVGAWKREIHRGRGIVLLRGLPVERYDTAGRKRIALGLGCHFGRPVSQSAMGDLVGEVMDVGGRDRRERAYRNSRELRLHTDRCDHIGMLCIRPHSAGESAAMPVRSRCTTSFSTNGRTCSGTSTAAFTITASAGRDRGSRR